MGSSVGWIFIFRRRGVRLLGLELRVGRLVCFEGGRRLGRSGFLV